MGTTAQTWALRPPLPRHCQSTPVNELIVLRVPLRATNRRRPTSIVKRPTFSEPVCPSSSMSEKFHVRFACSGSSVFTKLVLISDEESFNSVRAS